MFTPSTTFLLFKLTNSPASRTPGPPPRPARTCAFWLGRSPSSFYLLYGGVGAVLMAARWASYISRKWHYYLVRGGGVGDGVGWWRQGA